MVKYALVSVFNKTGIVNFCKFLNFIGYRILSTGKTEKLLFKNGVDVIKISKYINFSEILKGRVKTLHPKIFSGILYRRNSLEDIKEIKKLNFFSIDIVVVNLYPFESIYLNKNFTLEEKIENIDIGGVSLLRAAAKNYKYVISFCKPKYYSNFIKNFNDIFLYNENRVYFAKKSFKYIFNYDKCILDYFKFFLGNKKCKIKFINFFKKDILNFTFQKVHNLHYGENPHQLASFYRDININTLLKYKKIQGKELSYNNILDINIAWNCAKKFNECICIIVKHANPCGVAMDLNVSNAFKKALNVDKISSFGGVIIFNKKVNSDVSKKIIKSFFEILIATSFSKKSLEILSTKKNMRLIKIRKKMFYKNNPYEFRSALGGILIQNSNNNNFLNTIIVSKKYPTYKQFLDMIFAWKIVKYVKSNSIVFCKDCVTLGIGTGQMSRIDSVKFAVLKAKNSGFSLLNSVVASDAFFPFRDNIDVIASSGAKCIIQPGGSIRDKEIIDAVNKLKIVMIFTGVRNFSH